MVHLKTILNVTFQYEDQVGFQMGKCIGSLGLVVTSGGADLFISFVICCKSGGLTLHTWLFRPVSPVSEELVKSFSQNWLISFS